MPAASALRAENLVGDRRAEQGGTPLRGPARLVEQPVWHCARHPSRELSDEGLRLGAQGTAHADGKGQEGAIRGQGWVASRAKVRSERPSHFIAVILRSAWCLETNRSEVRPNYVRGLAASTGHHRRKRKV